MTVLKVDSLSKSFGGVHVLTDVSFSVEAGERLALIGPNGAGKSTLLNLIGGQLPASGGDVFLAGGEEARRCFEQRFRSGAQRLTRLRGRQSSEPSMCNITKLSPHNRLHLGLGRSYQVNNLFFHQSVMDNLLLAVYGAQSSHGQMWNPLEKKKHFLAEAERLLEAVGLKDKRAVPLHMLSYGEQRLVELVAAYASRPKVVLLDEPSAGLPTAEAEAFAEVVRELTADTTLIFCAHDMDLVFNLADSIMVLYEGTILTRGTPEVIGQDPKVREIYLGEDRSC